MSIKLNFNAHGLASRTRGIVPLCRAGKRRTGATHLLPEATLAADARRSLQRRFNTRAESLRMFRKNQISGRINRRCIPVQQEPVEIECNTIRYLGCRRPAIMRVDIHDIITFHVVFVARKM